MSPRPRRLGIIERPRQPRRQLRKLPVVRRQLPGAVKGGLPTVGPSTPRAPSAPAAPGAGAPSATPGAPAAGGSTLADDAQSAAERAALKFRTDNDRATIEQQGAYDRTDFQEALRRMATQRPKDERATREGANRQGLFYSGQLGKRLGELAVDYQRREGDARSEFDRREAAREAARRALESGMSIDDAAISAQLAERQVGRDAEAADAGGLVGPDALPVAGPASKKKRHVVRGSRGTRGGVSTRRA